MLVGTYATVERLVLERNVIHNCGPAGSKFEHLVYLNHTRNAVVRWNTLTGNAGGWAVHLYDDADGTLVEHNLIDGNHGGVVFAGDSAERSDDNVVRDNIITFGARAGASRGRGAGRSGHGQRRARQLPLHDRARRAVRAGAAGGLQRALQPRARLLPLREPRRRRPTDSRRQPVQGARGSAAGPDRHRAPAPSGGGNARRRARRPGKRITLNAPRRVRPGQIIRLSGRLWRGRPRGRRVRIQVNFGRWSTFAHTTSRKRGRFSFRIQTRRQRRARTLRMRVAAKGYGHRAPWSCESRPEPAATPATIGNFVRALVTGGAGFIGSHLVTRSSRRGHDVRVLDNFSTGRRSNLARRGDIELVEGDLRTYERVPGASAACEWSSTRRALPSVPRSVEDPLRPTRRTSTGTLNVLLAARDAGVRRVVFAASSSVYGEHPGLPKRETRRRPALALRGVQARRRAVLPGVHRVYGAGDGGAALLQRLRPAPGPDSQYAAVIPKFITLMLAASRR